MVKSRWYIYVFPVYFSENLKMFTIKCWKRKMKGKNVSEIKWEALKATYNSFRSKTYKKGALQMVTSSISKQETLLSLERKSIPFWVKGKICEMAPRPSPPESTGTWEHGNAQGSCSKTGRFCKCELGSGNLYLWKAPRNEGLYSRKCSSWTGGMQNFIQNRKPTLFRVQQSERGHFCWVKEVRKKSHVLYSARKC